MSVRELPPVATKPFSRGQDELILARRHEEKPTGRAEIPCLTSPRNVRNAEHGITNITGIARWHPLESSFHCRRQELETDICLVCLFLGFLRRRDPSRRRRKVAIKLHSLLPLRGYFATVIVATPGSVHDVAILDQLTWEAMLGPCDLA